MKDVVIMEDTRECNTLLFRNEIPIIDLALKDQRIAEIGKQLHNALTANGFVFLINHGIAEEKIKSVYKLMDTFCDLPDNVKDQYTIHSSEQIQGYIAIGMEKLKSDGEKEMKHTFNVVRLTERLPTKDIPNFKEVVADVMDEFVILTNFLLKTIAKAQGIDPDLLLHLHKGMLQEDNLTALRMLYYPPLGENPPANITRCGEHSDWGTFTLLTQDGEGGLEVFRAGEWRCIGHLPGAIIMNVGDIMEVWTSSKYKSARHRVVVPEDPVLRNTGRHSTAFFVFPDDKTLLDPSIFRKHQCVDAKQDIAQGQEKMVTAYEYLQHKREVAIDKMTVIM